MKKTVKRFAVILLLIFIFVFVSGCKAKLGKGNSYAVKEDFFALTEEKYVRTEYGNFVGQKENSTVLLGPGDELVLIYKSNNDYVFDVLKAKEKSAEEKEIQALGQEYTKAMSKLGGERINFNVSTYKGQRIKISKENIDKYLTLISENSNEAIPDKNDILVRVISVNNINDIASILLEIILEEEMGYIIKPTDVNSVKQVLSELAAGNQDVYPLFFSQDYAEAYKNVESKVEILDPIYEVQEGWIVPAYVTVDSIEELNDYSDKFQNQVMRIFPHLTPTDLSQTAVKEYGLKDFKVIDDFSALFDTSIIAKAIEAKEWIITTGWRPHSMFAWWNLKFLNDPKGIFGKPIPTNILVRKGLKDDMPELYGFLSRFHLDSSQMAAIYSLLNEEGAASEEIVRRWIKENQEIVDSWIK